MRKFTFISISLIITFNILRCQTIPNSSFENWSTQGSYEEPTGGWFTLNGLCTQAYPAYGVSKTTDCVDGQYAAKLVSGILNVTSYGMGYDTTAILSTGVLSTSGPIWGFPCSQRPLTLKFYYKYFPANNLMEDTARIYIILQKWNTLTWQRDNIGNGFLKLVSSVPNYTQGIITINYNSSAAPDTATIDITSSLSHLSRNSDNGWSFINFTGSTLFIDKLEFGFITNISEELISTGYILYPNPASDFVALTDENLNYNDVTINIYSIMGILVRSEILKQNHQKIDIEDLCNGVYFVSIKSKEWSKKQKLIIQR